MVARGIEEKGWQEAIDAFILMRENTLAKSHLILVGESYYLTELKIRYESEKQIHFVGFSENAIDWITLFDVGLLPTYYPAESLPNSVVEYLYCGKPVISTQVAEIPEMISYEGKLAGFILKTQFKKANVAELSDTMCIYLNNCELLKEHKALAKLAFQKFDMEICVREYTSLFEQVIKCGNPTS